MKIESNKIEPSPSRSSLQFAITRIEDDHYRDDHKTLLQSDDNWKCLRKHVEGLLPFSLGDQVRFKVSGELEGVSASVNVEGAIVDIKLCADNTGWFVHYGIAEDRGCAYHSPVVRWWRRSEDIELLP